jgi:hypothetical protein
MITFYCLMLFDLHLVTERCTFICALFSIGFSLFHFLIQFFTFLLQFVLVTNFQMRCLDSALAVIFLLPFQAFDQVFPP